MQGGFWQAAPVEAVTPAAIVLASLTVDSTSRVQIGADWSARVLSEDPPDWGLGQFG